MQGYHVTKGKSDDAGCDPQKLLSELARSVAGAANRDIKKVKRRKV
jgi:hypothetical protein